MKFNKATQEPMKQTEIVTCDNPLCKKVFVRVKRSQYIIGKVKNYCSKDCVWATNPHSLGRSY